MLALGGGDLVIDPDHGGSIVGWRRGADLVLRPAAPALVVGGDVHAAACFPLVPYANRIATGRFGGHRLTPNFGIHPHTLHGIGWHRPWRVTTATAQAATLELAHRPAAEGDWPYAFDAELTYALDQSGLAITISQTNRSGTRAPAGLGHHPYFPRRPGARLSFAATGVWRNDATALPRDHVDVPPEWDHRTARTVGSIALDNCFTGWDGAVRLEWDGGGLLMTADPVFANLQVYVPHGSDHWCVEPVTHAPDAINRPTMPSGQAMHVLDPGETLRGTVRLTFI